MDERRRIRRLLGVGLLLLCLGPIYADAQEFVCRPIVRGDTASRLARQLTGNAAAAYSNAFQIRDPARGMFVPKSQYRRLSTDWQACVARGPVTDVPLTHARVVAPAGALVVPEEPVITSPLPALSAAPFPAATRHGTRNGVFFAATIAGSLLLTLLTYVAIGHSFAPRAVPPFLQRAGEDFVSAFARPLTDVSSSVPPIQARLRFVRRKAQLEISLAPGPGHRYPNLVDHKGNVEYDVGRVMRLLGPDVVVSDRLRARGKWVVVPIRLADATQAGAK